MLEAPECDWGQLQKDCFLKLKDFMGSGWERWLQLTSRLNEELFFMKMDG